MTMSKEAVVNRLVFEFRPGNPNGTPTEQDVHLYCGRVGKFSTKALQIVRGALDSQIEESLKEEAVAGHAWQNVQNVQNVVPPLAYGSASPKPQVLSQGLSSGIDPYDPKHWDASQYDPSRYEVKS